jgi:hypothetical protein
VATVDHFEKSDLWVTCAYNNRIIDPSGFPQKTDFILSIHRGDPTPLIPIHIKSLDCIHRSRVHDDP